MASREQQHPFYKPLWRRIAIVAVIVLWLAFEIYQDGGGLWVALAAGMLAYAVYTFFITWPAGHSKDDAGPSA
jgi:hypothetical protein